jgi:hypothetical protein
VLAVDGVLVDLDFVTVALAAVPCFACHLSLPSFVVVVSLCL